MFDGLQLCVDHPGKICPHHCTVYIGSEVFQKTGGKNDGEAVLFHDARNMTQLNLPTNIDDRTHHTRESIVRLPSASVEYQENRKKVTL